MEPLTRVLHGAACPTRRRRDDPSPAPDRVAPAGGLVFFSQCFVENLAIYSGDAAALHRNSAMAGSSDDLQYFPAMQAGGPSAELWMRRVVVLAEQGTALMVQKGVRPAAARARSRRPPTVRPARGAGRAYAHSCVLASRHFLGVVAMTGSQVTVRECSFRGHMWGMEVGDASAAERADLLSSNTFDAGHSAAITRMYAKNTGQRVQPWLGAWEMA